MRLLCRDTHSTWEIITVCGSGMNPGLDLDGVTEGFFEFRGSNRQMCFR